MVDDLERQPKARGHVKVNVEPHDTVESVMRKLRTEGRRRRALELSNSDLQGIALGALREARY